MPVDGVFPFFHLDRKFMHLGFHIYDVGFQSPNVEASKPMVFVTTLLLLAIVLAMTSVAIYLRNRMRKRIRCGPFEDVMEPVEQPHRLSVDSWRTKGQP